MRMTAPRRAVFEAIFAAHGHLDADQLHDAMTARGQNVSRATVYRNLELLVEAGLVRRHNLGGRRDLYEHIHPGQNHDHLVCRDCGLVVEFVSESVRSAGREICGQHDFDAGDATVQILGRCPVCAGGAN